MSWNDLASQPAQERHTPGHDSESKWSPALRKSIAQAVTVWAEPALADLARGVEGSFTLNDVPGPERWSESAPNPCAPKDMTLASRRQLLTVVLKAYQDSMWDTLVRCVTQLELLEPHTRADRSERDAHLLCSVNLIALLLLLSFIHPFIPMDKIISVYSQSTLSVSLSRDLKKEILIYVNLCELFFLYLSLLGLSGGGHIEAGPRVLEHSGIVSAASVGGVGSRSNFRARAVSIISGPAERPAGGVIRRSR